MKMYDVFLSHNSTDKPLVEKIATRLVEEAKIKPFLDKWHLIPGERWQEALEEALDNSAACAVFIGPNGMGSWENQEMRSALDDHVRDMSMRVIPVLLPGANSKDIIALPRFLRHLTWVDFTSGIDSEVNFRQFIAAIRGESPNKLYLSNSKNLTTVPSRPHHKLIGREGLLSELKKRLFNFESISLNGLPGVGKTAIAIELSNDIEVLDYFNNQVLWVSLGPNPDVFSSLGDMAEAVNIPFSVIQDLSTIEARMKAVNTAIGQRQMLFVIDDVWGIDEALDLRLGNAKCAHILTTTNLQVALVFASIQNETIKELSASEGLLLLSHFVPEVVKSDSESSRDLVEVVGGLPLALVLIGNHLKIKTRGRPRSVLKIELEKLLRESRERLCLTYQEGRLSTRQSLDAIIGMSIESLEAPALVALSRLSIFPPKPSSFSEEAALNLSDAPENIYALIDCGLLEFLEPDRYTFNKIIRDYISYTQKKPFDPAVVKKMVKYYISFIEKHEKDNKVFDLEKDNILKAFELSSQYDLYEEFINGINKFYHYMEARGLYELAEKLLIQAKTAAERIQDDKYLIEILFKLGTIAIFRDKYILSEQYFIEGLALAKRLDDDLNAARFYLGLGKVSFLLNKFGVDSEYFIQGMKIAHQIGNEELIVDFVTSLGEMEDIRGDYGKAREYLQDGLERTRRDGDEERYCSLLLHLGWVIAHLGDFAEAEKIWKEGLELVTKIDNRGNLSFFHSVLGWINDRCGRYEDAEEHFLEGIKLSQELGYLHVLSILLTNLGAARIHRGDYARAQNALSEALEIVLHSGHDERRAIILENLGIIECKLGNFDKAEEYFNEGVQLANSRIKERVSALKSFLGEVYFNKGKVPQALEYTQEALNLAIEIRNPERIAVASSLLGALSESLGNHGEAEKHLSIALENAQKLNYRWLIGSILNDIGSFHLNDDKDKAHGYFSQAMEIGKEIDSRDLMASALYGYSKCFALTGNGDSAISHANESLSIFRQIGHYKETEVRAWSLTLSKKGDDHYECENCFQK